MLVDVTNTEIEKENSINDLFSRAVLKDIDLECKILNSDFYLDSFNCFPITTKYQTFHALFKRQDDNQINHFYSEEFYKNLIEKKSEFKIIKDSFVLGSSPADNYFSNLIFFLPRIFFTNQKKINLVIHRNLSNKFRNLMMLICKMREVDIKFSFIDDNFYLFKNSSIPQFSDIKNSIKVLNFFIKKILPNINTPEFGPKIYIRREDASYRKILNEADLIDKLKKNNFEIINPQHFEILEQMKIFSNAETIISPYGSNLSNIIFCKKGTKIVEISPEFNSDYEKNISARYNDIANILDLKFQSIKVDSVDVEKHSELAKKYIHPKILKNSNYYKNMILKISDIDELINNL